MSKEPKSPKGEKALDGSQQYWEQNCVKTHEDTQSFLGDYKRKVYDKLVSLEAKIELAKDLIKEGFENFGGQIKDRYQSEYRPTNKET
jgi:hypothetical protein